MTSEIQSLSFTVAEELEGQRLDKGISEYYEDISRSRINGLIKEGGVLVNGRSAKASYRLEAGDEVSFSLASAEIPDIEPEDIPIDILYEDEDILIVNKPKGMVVHPAAGHYTGTLVNALRSVGDQRGNATGYSTPDRQGYYRVRNSMQE